MSVRPSLRIGPALLGLAVIVAACSGAGNDSLSGPAGESSIATSASTPADPATAEPTFDLGILLSPDPSPDATPAASPSPPLSGPGATPKPVNPVPPVVSTAHAANLHSQVDHLLNELDGQLANADDAATNPGE